MATARLIQNLVPGADLPQQISLISDYFEPKAFAYTGSRNKHFFGLISLGMSNANRIVSIGTLRVNR